MAQPSEMHAPWVRSRVATIQKWLTRLSYVFPCAVLAVLILGSLLGYLLRSHFVSHLSLVSVWPTFGVGVAITTIGQGIIVYLFPERTVGEWRRAVVRVGWPRLMGVLLIWLGVWCGGTYLIMTIGLVSGHQTPDDVFIIGNVIGLAPYTVLLIVAWIRRRPERRRARAEAAQALAAWMMMNMRAATTEQTAGRERSRWRDRWRNRVRRAQRRTRT